MTHTPTSDKLKEQTLENLDLILNALHIEYKENGSRFFFPCPIHGSDNYNSMTIYKNTGIAKCYTMNCTEYNGGSSIFSFVGAVLKSDWREGKEFCRKVLSGISPEVASRTRPEKIDYRVKEIDRSLIIPYVDPNIEFYLRRGYTKEIIEQYDMFICKKKNNLMYGRITIPIYNDEHTHAVGFLGRSLNPQCTACRKFHRSNIHCPVTAYEHIKSEKWVNSRGLSRNKLLFNYWFAHKSVSLTKEVILVESPGNAIKITQAGVPNVMAMFGTALSKKQIEKLDELRPERVYLGLDPDKAGEAALLKIQEQLLSYQTIPLIPPEKDFGDMPCDEIRSFIRSANVKF